MYFLKIKSLTPSGNGTSTSEHVIFLTKFYYHLIPPLEWLWVVMEIYEEIEVFEDGEVLR